jgi:hypothetical protein
MTDEHRAAALEGWLANPVAQAYEQAQRTAAEQGLWAWLHERVAEHRAAAQFPVSEGTRADWTEVASGVVSVGDDLDDLLALGDLAISRHVVANDPRAVLALCDSHTAILDVHHADTDGTCVGCATHRWGEPWAPDIGDCPTLRAVTIAYQHHPGYQERWRP